MIYREGGTGRLIHQCERLTSYPALNFSDGDSMRIWPEFSEISSTPEFFSVQIEVGVRLDFAVSFDARFTGKSDGIFLFELDQEQNRSH